MRLQLRDILLAFHQLVEKCFSGYNNTCSWTKKQISESTSPSVQVGVNWALMLSLNPSIHFGY